METHTVTSPSKVSSSKFSTEWRMVTKPGIYTTVQGSLVRFPAESLKAGHSPIVEIESNLDTRLAFLAADPKTTTEEARQLATRLSLPINF
ncbi:MAG TPA: hypothetical protein VFI25_02440 [Planctomycetota bacterium]|jgi:hypothetical protein|nr:hypothetical protein [Planctomycetota bacterium]